MSLSSSMNPSLSLITRNPNPSLKILPNLPIKIRANPNPNHPSRICFTNLRFTPPPQLRFSLKVNGIGGRGGGGGNGRFGYGNGGWGEDDEKGFGSIERRLLLFGGALALTLFSLILLGLKEIANEERKQCEPMDELKVSTALLDEYRRFRNLVIKALNLGEEFMVEELKKPIDSKAEELENYRRQKLRAAVEDNDQVTTTNVGGGSRGGGGGKSVEGAQDGGAKLVQLRCGESANLTILGGEVRELNTGEGAEIEILFPRGGGKLHIKY